MPQGQEAGFAKVLNLRTTAEADVPAELREQFHKAHESLEEAAAEQDDKLLEEFLAGQPDPDKAPERFVKFDADKDGVLSRDEFIDSGNVPR